MLPLVPVWVIALLARAYWHRLRFPYNLLALKTAVSALHEEPSTIDSYVQGVLRGYATNASERHSFCKNYALEEGFNVGGKLRRGEITFEQIPPRKISENTQQGLLDWLLNRITRS